MTRVPLSRRGSIAWHAALVACATTCVVVATPDRASEVTLQQATPAALTVNWLRATTAGTLTVLSTQTYPANTSTTIAIGSAEDYIRVLRAAAAPVTLSAIALTRAKTITSPAPAPGGEIFARREGGTVVAKSIRVTSGTTTRELVLQADGAAASGALPAGRYRLEPVYAGDVAGPAMSVDVTVGATTDVFLSKDRVGGVAVSQDADACDQGAIVRVTEIARPSGPDGPAMRRVVATAPVIAGCQERVEGLAPGRYEVALTGGAAGFNISREVDVVAQTIAEVAQEAPVVRVAGTVLLNGKAAAGLHLAFSGPPARPGDHNVTIVDPGSSGGFEARLPAPGTYRVTAMSGRMPLLGGDRLIDVVVGYNAFDWAIEGGAVTVRITNWDRSTPVEISMRRVNAKAGTTSGAEIMVEPSESLPIIMNGLGAADYEIQARQQVSRAAVKISARVPFSIEAGRPSATVDLSLEDYAATLVLRDPAGRPIAGAVVSTYWGRAKETRGGVFSLSGAQATASTPLQIRAAGFVSTCRLAPVSGHQLDVVLETGRPARVRFPGLSLARAEGQIRWPGADCAVPLSAFDSSIASDASGTTFKLSRFPSVTSFTFDALPTVPPMAATMGADGVFQIVLRGGG